MNVKTLDKTPDANRDPLTGTPGSHPVGTGIGAAAGGIAAGAAAGTLAAGPVGTVIGAAVGAVAGGLAGKAVAEKLDPTVIDDYWKDRYSREPYYEREMSFDDYRPSYQLGAEARQRYPERSFDEVESDLSREYETARGTSRLSWEKAKRSARAAWETEY